MLNWNKITLFKFQQIDEINSRKDLSQLDKTLFSVCTVFDMTEYELDANPRRAVKLIGKVDRIFKKEFKTSAYSYIGEYTINYDPSKLTFGQYIEIAFFLQQGLKGVHYVLASISSADSDKHRERAEYFHKQSISKVLGCYQEFMKNLEVFNKEYSSLFGLDADVHGSTAIASQFNKRYGWIYSAEQVAAYERITLDEAYALSIRRALNDLAYLKAKGKYEAEQLKRN